MSVILSYLIKGSNQDVIDLRTPGREYELVGQSVIVTGSTASNIVYSAPGVELDARALGGGEDVIVFTHAWSDYVKDTGSVAGGIVFTYVDSVAGLTERVIVGNGVATLTRDLLVFKDGAVLTQNVNTAIRANPNVAISTVTGYNAAITNESIVVPADSGSTTSVRASSTGPGAVFAMSTPGQVTQLTGTSGVDKVYIKAGSVVDARGLLGGEDIIYFAGNWSDYAKSATAVSGAIQFTRSIGGRTETVTVGNGVSTQSRDRLVFADGAVLTQNINNALRTDPGVAISAITGYDSATTTPFLSDVSSVTFSGGQSSGLTNGTANAGDTVVFDVAMKSAVTVSTAGGTPRLAINVGGQTKFADYDAASSTGTTLRFKYVVAAGDTDVNGISVAENAIDLHGGSITVDRSGAAAGLKHSALSDNTSFKVDTTAPSITSVAFIGQTGAVNHTLNAGDTVTLEVSFGEAVFVSGTPILRIKVGSQDRNAVYVSGSGTSKLQFLYTVVTGDADSDGLSVDAGSLSISGGSLKDAAGNDASLSHVGVTADANYKVDAVAPILSSLAISGQTGAQNNLLNAGDTVTLEATFSESVVVTGTPSIGIRVGATTRNAVYVGGSGTNKLQFRYTIAAGDGDANGISIGQDSLLLTNASIRDAAGNDAVPDHAAVASVASLQVDTTHPTISYIGVSGSDQAGSTLVAGDTLYVSASFTKAVIVDFVGDQPYVSIQVGGETRQAHYVSGSGTDVLVFSYTIVADDVDADGISVPADALVPNGSIIQDLAGNEAIVTSSATPDDASAIVDAVQPFVVSASVAETDAADGLWSHAGDTVFIDLTFSEAVLVDVSTGTPTLLIQIGSETRQAVYVAGSGSATLQFSYQVQPGDDAPASIGVPQNALFLNGASISDLSGNEALLANDQSEPDPSFRVDAIVPSIASIEVESVDRNGVDRLIENDSVSFAVRFTEAVSVETIGGTPVLRILVGNVEREAVYTSGSGSDLLVFTYVVGADDEDSDGLSVVAGALDLAGGAIRDVSGNDAFLEHGALADDPNLTVDGTSPAIVDVGFDMVRTSLVNGFVGTDRSVYVTIAFDDTVWVDTGAGQPSLRLLVDGIEKQAVYVDGSGSAVLTFAYLPDAGDTDGDGIEIVPDSLALNGAKITDAEGNTALLDHGGQDGDVVIRVDAVAPTITDVVLDSVQGETNALLSVGDSVTFGLVFSKDIYVEMQGGVPGVLLDVGGVQKIARYTHGSGSGTLYFTYLVEEGDRDQDGITLVADSLFLDGSSITDLAGNSAGTQHGAVLADSEYGVDTDIPYVLSLAAVPAQGHDWLTLGQSVQIAVKFSKAVEVGTGAGIPGVLLDIGGVERLAHYVSGSGSDELIFSYEVQAGDTDADGVAIPEDGIRLAGGVIADLAGNAADLAAAAVLDDAFVKVDATTAQIQSVEVSDVATSAPGWLRLGDSVSFSVTFDKAVVVDTALGEPHLRIMLGGEERFATFAGGSGSSVLTFVYTISSGDEASGGISVPATSLEPGTATITDLAGNEANLTHAELPADPAMGVDAVAPAAVEVLITADAGEYSKVGDAIVVTVRFTQDVIVDLAGGRPFIGVRMGDADRQAVYAGGDGTDTLTFVYIVAEDDAEIDGVSVGENGIDLAGGRIHDLAGNDAVLDNAAVDVDTVKIDTVAPQIEGVTVAETTGQSGVPLTVGDTITFAMTFDSPLVVDLSAGLPELRILIGTDERYAIFSGLDGDRVLRFTYAIADGDHASTGIAVPADSLYLGAAIITDAAGNLASSLHPAMDGAFEYEVDAVAPAAPLLTLAGNLAGGSTLDEASQATGLVEVTGEAGGEITVVFANGLNKITKILTGNGAAQSIALTEQEVLALGSGTISISASERDAVGNRSVTATTQFTLDMQGPTIGQVAIAGATGMVGSYANAGDIINLTLTFSEAVQVSGIPNLRFQIGTSTRRASYVSGSGTTTLTFAYKVQDGENDSDGISIAADGLVLNGGQIQDIAGNPAVLTHAAVAANPNYLVDTTKPLLTQTSFDGLAHILPTTSLVLTFDKIVAAGTGFIRLDNGSGDVRTISVTDSSQVTISGHTVTIAPTGGLQPFSTYQISFGKGVILDTIGNAFAGITSGSHPVPVWSPVVKLAEVAAGDGGFAVFGSATTHAGLSVAGLGDVNGDGLADIVIGAPNDNGFTGRAYVVYGKTTGASVSVTALGTGGYTITGETTNNSLGFDVSSAGDVNGDGLGDLLVGAWNNATTATNAGRAYLILGRTDGAMGGTSVDVLGDASANALGDGGAAMTIVAGAGDDVVTLSAAGSIAYAGAGNDVIHINGAMISALTAKYGAGGNLGQLATIGGGSGVDTLTLDGAGLTLDLTQVSNASASLPNGSSRITSVERVDLTGTGNNTLKLSLNDVLDMSEANLFATTGRHQLMVTGDAGDTVQLGGLTSWTKSGTVDYAGGTYDAWNHNTALGTVYVLQTLTVLPV